MKITTIGIEDNAWKKELKERRRDITRLKLYRRKRYSSSSRR